VETVTYPTQRDRHLLAIESESRFALKRTSGYYDQAHAENVFSRFKRTFGDRLRAKRAGSKDRYFFWPIRATNPFCTDKEKGEM
jgi:hypothetical protein